MRHFLILSYRIVSAVSAICAIYCFAIGSSENDKWLLTFAMISGIQGDLIELKKK